MTSTTITRPAPAADPAPRPSRGPLKGILLGLGAVVLIPAMAILGLAAAKPDAFQVERTAHIQAPADQVFDRVNDFRQWPAWSPWEKLDPQMQRTLSGPASGKGAVYAWAGNEAAGKGRMEIVEATAPSRIAIALSFAEPFQSASLATWTFEPAAGGTRVTWAMEGRHTFMSKVIAVVMDFDQVLGKDFEAGLANLKALAEERADGGRFRKG